MPTCRPDLCDQCPRVYLPVCSSDSKTYRNECFFMCRRANNTITVLHKGVCMHWLWQFYAPRLSHVDVPTCRPDLCDQCPRVYLPVCSSDSKTYRNECFFMCRRANNTITVLHKGVCMHWLCAPRLSHIDVPTCRPDLCDQCPRVYLPVCSSDSKTYRNECFFMCRRANSTISVLHKGVCMHWLCAPRLSHIDVPTCRPDLCDQCPRVYLPVCSSDSKTYRNECFFMCRRANNTITVLHKGVCMHWLWQF
ncbi:serine protease inhibitor dipetalogastin-like [Cydia fagiglandana]|uniref:serine protease inhibitor dipetalogastin-like n=1 Tax=Cydia fagiglandana TaxID=1458189 RepID=UPI002FEDEB27